MAKLNKLIMINIVVSDMPKAKDFYADKLGFKVVTDYRQDDDNWWVGLAAPEGGAISALLLKPRDIGVQAYRSILQLLMLSRCTKN